MRLHHLSGLLLFGLLFLLAVAIGYQIAAVLIKALLMLLSAFHCLVTR